MCNCANKMNWPRLEFELWLDFLLQINKVPARLCHSRVKLDECSDGEYKWALNIKCLFVLSHIIDVILTFYQVKLAQSRIQILISCGPGAWGECPCGLQRCDWIQSCAINANWKHHKISAWKNKLGQFFRCSTKRWQKSHKHHPFNLSVRNFLVY